MDLNINTDKVAGYHSNGGTNQQVRLLAFVTTCSIRNLTIVTVGFQAAGDWWLVDPEQESHQ